MRRFWDRRASEDAFHFVDNRVPYKSGDQARFWSSGANDLDTLLGIAGASIAPTDRVLEIDCGVGRLTRPMAERAGEIVAVDVSAEMLGLARRHNTDVANITWVLGDGASLAGIDDGSVDACISHVVFQHLPDPGITLGYVREMGRVLRPGGWSAFQFSNDPRVHHPAIHGGRAVRARRWLLARAGRAPGGQSDPAWLGSAVELDDLRRATADSGLEIRRLEGAGTQFCVALATRVPGP